ncbi:MAG: ABC transporter permease, partial [Stutzerimonas stutzeri]
MFGYFIQRLVYVVPVALGVSVICFLLVHIAPGDPLTSIIGIDATAEQQAALRAAYGFDKPLPVQYFIWLGNTLQGDLGTSIATGRPVAGEVMRAIGNTFILACAASLIGFSLGILLGFVAGYFKDTVLDRAVTGLSIAGVSVPNYWLGIVLIAIFSVKLGWLPSVGAGPGGSSAWKWDLEHLRFIVLPAVTLAIVPMGIVSRTVRALVADALSQDFVGALAAKGLGHLAILRHVLRNVAPAMLSVVGLQLGY